ncbi:hypothetical protein PHMEG_00024478 [Phytophthora megakarya]|uniref:Ubiquitin-like protease family profile domain-containing protein n=1 Tax=Phytophthora megakarya TaxID=4795 RepID=A0A225VF48_9STRA|nr:hypothetical protein PHMEG_00024478 [Phytophthora megakarya]
MEKGAEVSFENVATVATAVDGHRRSFIEINDILSVIPVPHDRAARKIHKTGKDKSPIIAASVPFIPQLIQKAVDTSYKMPMPVCQDDHDPPFVKISGLGHFTLLQICAIQKTPNFIQPLDYTYIYQLAPGQLIKASIFEVLGTVWAVKHDVSMIMMPEFKLKRKTKNVNRPGELVNTINSSTTPFTIDTNSILVYDPFRNSKYVAFLKKITRRFEESEEFKSFDVVVVAPPIRKEGNSCGVYVDKFMLMLLDESVKGVHEDSGLMEFRYAVLKSLLSA